MKKPPCVDPGPFGPPIKALYMAEVFDPALKAKRVVAVNPDGFCKNKREVDLGIDRVDRWARVDTCCVKHAIEEFKSGRVTMWLG